MPAKCFACGKRVRVGNSVVGTIGGKTVHLHRPGRCPRIAEAKSRSDAVPAAVVESPTPASMPGARLARSRYFLMPADTERLRIIGELKSYHFVFQAPLHVFPAAVLEDRPDLVDEMTELVIKAVGQ